MCRGAAALAIEWRRATILADAHVRCVEAETKKREKLTAKAMTIMPPAHPRLLIADGRPRMPAPVVRMI